MINDVLVVFEAELNIEIEPPYSFTDVAQYVQNEIGHTGAVITEVLIADGATDE